MENGKPAYVVVPFDEYIGAIEASKTYNTAEEIAGKEIGIADEVLNVYKRKEENELTEKDRNISFGRGNYTQKDFEEIGIEDLPF